MTADSQIRGKYLKLIRAEFFKFCPSFCVTWEVGVDRQSHTGLIYYFCILLLTVCCLLSVHA